MEDAAIYSRLHEIFEAVFDKDDIEIAPETEAKDVQGWDSLTHVRLILTIERIFKTRFSTAEVGKLKNVGDLVALIKEHA
jgi:acyl carrier protein